jgi:hypothetical protein
MIVWLASYPRSGNHLLRTILQCSFGLGSYEIYQKIVPPIDPQLSMMIGERRFEDENADAFVTRARASPEIFLVKTHGLVPDSDKCIYVVRDARAALVSYQRYLADIENKSSTLPDLIAGRLWPGKWHVHVRRFLARDPGNTMILRYEDLASGTPPLQAISRFLHVDPIRPFDVSFAELRELSPRIFPTGNNRAGVDIIERDYSWLFWRHCGEMMRASGYVPQTGRSAADAVAAFVIHPARYVGAIVWPALRSRLPARRNEPRPRSH